MGKNSTPPKNYTNAPAEGGGLFGGLGRGINKGIQNTQGLVSGGLDAITGAPPTGDYTGAAEQQSQSSANNINAQTRANRPGQNSPFGFTQWSQDANGNWTQNSGLNGGLGDAANGLQNQAGQMAQPMDWSQFGKLDDGSAARDQAISAAYGQATSRLNPQWAQAAQQNASSLANAGLDPNSQAARGQNMEFQQGKNDAYGSAMNSAIMQGTQAQTATFNQNLQARQQAIAEALRKRGQPVDELQALQGFTQQPGFMGAGAADPAQYLAALMGQGNFDMTKWQAQQQMAGDAMDGYGQFLNAGTKLIPWNIGG